MQRWTADQAGTIFEGAAARTGDELADVVVQLAIAEGWRPSDRDDLDLISDKLDGSMRHRWLDNSGESEFLSDAADEAVAWLDEHIAPDGYAFEWDDGLILTAYDENGQV